MFYGRVIKFESTWSLSLSGHQRMAERISKEKASTLYPPRKNIAFTESPAGGRRTSITITLHNLINLSHSLRWVTANPEQSLSLGLSMDHLKQWHIGNHWNRYIEITNPASHQQHLQTGLFAQQDSVCQGVQSRLLRLLKHPSW